MNTTVAVAAIGFIATVTAAYLTGSAHRAAARDERILDAKVRIFGECAISLYEYHRATVNRVKARLRTMPDDDREPLRQVAYHANSRSRSAIGQVAILSGDDALRARLEEARGDIGDLNDATSEPDLEKMSVEILDKLIFALDSARSDLTKRQISKVMPWTRTSEQ